MIFLGNFIDIYKIFLKQFKNTKQYFSEIFKIKDQKLF